MFRLRTAIGLSVLALLVGIAGTAWLSTLTGDWNGPEGVSSVHGDRTRMMLRRHMRSPAPPARAVPDSAHASPVAPHPEELPTLTPIDMPPLPASWLQRTAFANGRVVLRLSVDDEGRVRQSAVEESSGNTALDERALRTAGRWRFAVPSDHPDGMTGTLVMRFDDAASTSL
jgi:protein TonB